MNIVIWTFPSLFIRSAFFMCRELSEVKLPNGLKTIHQNAFSHCGIKELVIPASAAQIGNSALATVMIIMPKRRFGNPRAARQLCRAVRRRK